MEKIRVGIFGFSRGGAYAKHFLDNNAEIVAVCEKDEKRLKRAEDLLGESASYYKDFDSFIEHEGLQAVLLANYFNEHTEYAVRLLEKNIHVLRQGLGVWSLKRIC